MITTDNQNSITQFEEEISSKLTPQQQRQADKLALIEAKAKAKREELLIKQQIKQQELAAKLELASLRNKNQRVAETQEQVKDRMLTAMRAAQEAREIAQQEQAAKQAQRQDLSQYLHPKNYAVTEDFDISRFREHFPTYDILEQAIVNTSTLRLKIRDTELPDFAGNRYLPSEIQEYLDYLTAQQCKGRTLEQAEEIMQRDWMLGQQVEDFKAQGYLPNQIVQLRTKVYVKS